MPHNGQSACQTTWQCADLSFTGATSSVHTIVKADLRVPSRSEMSYRDNLGRMCPS